MEPGSGTSDLTAGLSATLRECLACGFVIVDGHGKVHSISPEAARILNSASNGEGPQPTAELPQELVKLAAETVSSGERFPARLLQIDNVSGGQPGRTLRVMGEPVLLQNGTPGVALVVSGIPSLDTEDRVQRLERLATIGTLTASLGHELKNALVATRTFIDLLLERNAQSELGEVVLREVLRMDSLLSQMLRLASPAKPVRAPVRIHQVLDHSLRLVQHQIQSRPITLICNYSARQDAVMGNDYQLEQVFLNLLLNAVEAMGPNGRLTVSTIAAGDPDGPAAIEVTVEDTGPGIPAETYRRLFEPFFTTKNGGTGLGLAITRQIVESHQGKISVYTRPGEGSRFSIRLPLAGPSGTAR